VNNRRLEASKNGHSKDFDSQVADLRQSWADPRWDGTERTYTAADVIRLRGSVTEEHTLAKLGAKKLWSLLHS